jgi:CBS domain-containing protein
MIGAAIINCLSNESRSPLGRLFLGSSRGWLSSRRGASRSGLLWASAAVFAASAVALLLERRMHAGPGRSVRDVMVDDVLTIDASASITEAAQRMRDGNVGVLPVVEDGRLRGIVTDRDLVVRAVAVAADPATTRVGDCATWDTVCARAESPLDEVREVMAECQIGRLPVVDDDDRVIGIVTLSSLALRSRERGEALHTAQEVSRRSARSVA